MKRTLSILSALFIFLSAFGQENLGLRTLVIDAGHGGKDSGAISKDKSTYEKNLNLDIARKLQRLIQATYPEVKVIMTRDKDEFIELAERADIANRNNANLFLSIHINSTTGTKANGYSVHVLGQSSVKDRDLFAYNMDVVKRENAVMYLEDDYSTKYRGFDPDNTSSFIFIQLMQSANLEQSLDFAQIIADNMKSGPIKVNRGIWQNPFYVLWKTSMPAVLVELGFISNSQDLSSLRNESCRDALASILFKSFCEYKEKYDSSMSIQKDETKAEKPVEKAEEKATETVDKPTFQVERRNK